MSVNPRSLFLIIVALLTAGGTAMMARNWLRAERSQQVTVETEESGGETEVLIASTTLPIGHIVKYEDLKWQVWPEDGVTDMLVLSDSASPDDYTGSVVRQGIANGTPITDAYFVKPGDRGFLAAVLTRGMRAVSVPISATTGISGFVFPGDRVDLILTHEIINGESVRHASETVLTNVRILAVDQRTDDQENSPALAKTATLELTPKQVEKVAVVRQLGALSLSLRSLSIDDEEAPQRTAAGAPSKPSHTWDSEVSGLLPPVGGTARFVQVTVARGDKVSSIKFGKPKK